MGSLSVRRGEGVDSAKLQECRRRRGGHGLGCLHDVYVLGAVCTTVESCGCWAVEYIVEEGVLTCLQAVWAQFKRHDKPAPHPIIPVADEPVW